VELVGDGSHMVCSVQLRRWSAVACQVPVRCSCLHPCRWRCWHPLSWAHSWRWYSWRLSRSWDASIKPNGSGCWMSVDLFEAVLHDLVDHSTVRDWWCAWWHHPQRWAHPRRWCVHPRRWCGCWRVWLVWRMFGVC
jgi:hypothetical protein